VTPARLISGIITEAGVIRDPFARGLAEAVG
jgi:methylthioribose-1-phosphate isomerase